MHLLLHLAVFFSLGLAVCSVKCYVCAGAREKNGTVGDAECIESGGKDVTDCPYGCIKGVITTPAGIMVGRNCSVEKVEVDSCTHHVQTQGPFNTTADECYCKRNLCNNAPGIPSALSTTAALLGLLVIAH
ncbi:unnamed protein product [Bursaphelenchus xylophilus]|uniref:(pine wood nematode) hypothetical protein n=1 Tax=Bursaphelenchus xylophilus TaxID=6326 RepID=A0A7I8WXY6_BURXY|nr:unnamed protein product [Bursaphelenchus xylophilus]CAG9100795.1 unnamed protein product [Bursaphelenchus xylophilus]